MFKFTAYTDGACSGNPGIGGWGAVLLAEKNDEIIKRKELSGSAKETTNNQMELIAAIETLKALTKPTKIIIITDSNYVKKGITEWLPSWKKNNWKTSAKKEVKNKKLWQELEELVNKNYVREMLKKINMDNATPKSHVTSRIKRLYQSCGVDSFNRTPWRIDS